MNISYYIINKIIEILKDIEKKINIKDNPKYYISNIKDLIEKILIDNDIYNLRQNKCYMDTITILYLLSLSNDTYYIKDVIKNIERYLKNKLLYNNFEKIQNYCMICHNINANYISNKSNYFLCKLCVKILVKNKINFI
jgi:hypothetical protein